MEKYIKLFIVLIFVIVFPACPEEPSEHDTIIELKNNSNEDIVWFAIGHYITSDTSRLVESYPWYKVGDYKIAKGTTFIHDFYSGNMKVILSEGWKQYYFLNYDTVLNVPWERIRDENIILKKVYFETWEELEACNFTITYP